MRAPQPLAPDGRTYRETGRPPTRHVRPPCGLAALLVSGLAVLVSACGAGVPQTLEAPKLDAQTRTLYARTNLEKARALRAEGRIEVASSVARRGLSFEPDDPHLLRLQAELLAELGQTEQARVHRERADVVDPPPPPLDDAAHPLADEARDVLFVLLPPSPALLTADATRARLPLAWPDGAEARTLEERLRTRLPHTRIEVVHDEQHPTGRSVPAAQAWLAERAPPALVSLRIDRAFCGHSVKDGGFAVAWLRVDVALPGESSHDAHLLRSVLDMPSARADGESCESMAVARALERALALGAVERALTAPPSRARAFDAPSVRAAFPILDWQMQEEIAQGRRYLSLGELELARQHFRQAERIDPNDPVTRGFLDEVEHSLALASQLDAVGESDPRGARISSGNPDPADAGEGAHLGAQLSRSQRIGLEAQLADEEQRREQMLSALAVLYEMRNAPSLGTVANMRPGEAGEESGTGAALALQRLPAGSSVEVRTLYGPGGSVVARYYFSRDDEVPLVREEDTDADGAPDRWVGYEAGIISDVWESDGPGRPPSLHVVYAPGGSPIERVELDHDGDGRLDRVFIYSAGLLREESWDTDGDGAYDRFQRFDENGGLTLREEDVNGDEEIDVRTAYHNGRIVRREILNPELLSEIQ